MKPFSLFFFPSWQPSIWNMTFFKVNRNRGFGAERSRRHRLWSHRFCIKLSEHQKHGNGSLCLYSVLRLQTDSASWSINQTDSASWVINQTDSAPWAVNQTSNRLRLLSLNVVSVFIVLNARDTMSTNWVSIIPVVRSQTRIRIVSIMMLVM